MIDIPFTQGQIEAVAERLPDLAQPLFSQWALAQYGAAMMQVQAFECQLSEMLLCRKRQKPPGKDPKLGAERSWRKITHLLERATRKEVRKQLDALVTEELLAEVDYLILWRNRLAHRYFRQRMTELIDERPTIKANADTVFELYEFSQAFAHAVERIEHAKVKAMAKLPESGKRPPEPIPEAVTLVVAEVFVGLGDTFQKRPTQGEIQNERIDPQTRLDVDGAVERHRPGDRQASAEVPGRLPHTEGLPSAPRERARQRARRNLYRAVQAGVRNVPRARMAAGDPRRAATADVRELSEDRRHLHSAGADWAGTDARAERAHSSALYRTLDERGLAVGTRRLIHATLQRALNNAVAWDKIKVNAAVKANPPRQSTVRAQAWSTREVRRFLEYVKSDGLAALWRLALATGRRRGELAGLRWQDVDVDAWRLHVRQQALPTPGEVRFGPPKSRRSEGSIALDAETVEALRRHHDTQQLERSVAAGAYQDFDLVFCDAIGRPIRPTKLGEKFVELRKAAGIPVGSLHTTRHTHIMIALTEGVPVHVAAARAGDRPEQILSSGSASASPFGRGGGCCRRRGHRTGSLR
jgi:integrase